MTMEERQTDVRQAKTKAETEREEGGGVGEESTECITDRPTCMQATQYEECQ